MPSASCKTSLFIVPRLPPGHMSLVTGATSGLGRETALRLAEAGSKVYLLSRSTEKLSATIHSLQSASLKRHPMPPSPALDVHPLPCDLTSLASIRAAARSFLAKETKLDLLVNNAGIMATPYALTEDGYEKQWQVNYLAPFLLITLWLPALRNAAGTGGDMARSGGSGEGVEGGWGARVVNVGSDAAVAPIVPPVTLDGPNLSELKGTFAAWKRYSHSKLALLHMTAHLHTLSQQQGWRIGAYSVHPGIVRTGLADGDPTLLGKVVKLGVRTGVMPGVVSVEEGAGVGLRCGVSGERHIVDGSGAFFGIGGVRNRKGDEVLEKGKREGLGEKLWVASEDMVKERSD